MTCIECKTDLKLLIIIFILRIEVNMLDGLDKGILRDMGIHALEISSLYCGMQSRYI